MNGLDQFDVLIACEESGTMRDAMIAQGIRAISCDLNQSRRPGPHHSGDVRPLLRAKRWRLVIAHPVCRTLANSGLRWLYQGGRRWNPDGTENPIDLARWAEMEAACEFYAECWNADADRVAVENSKMHPHALRILSDKGIPVYRAQTVQPWWFADGEDGPDNVKKGAMWVTRGLPPLYATGTLDGSTARDECHKMAPGIERERLRSETKPGHAAAVAAQWGALATSPRRASAASDAGQLAGAGA